MGGKFPSASVQSMRSEQPESLLNHIVHHGDSSIFRMVIVPKVHWSENCALVRIVNSPTGRKSEGLLVRKSFRRSEWSIVRTVIGPKDLLSEVSLVRKLVQWS